jgi:heme O synthase-like polyprenyltransferase
MKRMSPLNTFVGAVIGALPVYLGWVATGRDVFAI